MRSKNNSDETSTTVEPVSTTPGGKKGRPTPKRKQAEAARIRPLVPADRKEAKRAARAARNARWEAEQRALVTGDEKHLPCATREAHAALCATTSMPATRSPSGVLLVMLASIILIMILSLFGNKIPEQTQVYILYGSTLLMYGSFIVTGVEAMLVWRKIKPPLRRNDPRRPRSRAAPATTPLAHDHAAPLAFAAARRSTAVSSRSSPYCRRPAPIHMGAGPTCCIHRDCGDRTCIHRGCSGTGHHVLAGAILSVSGHRGLDTETRMHHAHNDNTAHHQFC